jgi:type II secretory pathway pseudopilin PulG
MARKYYLILGSVGLGLLLTVGVVYAVIRRSVEAERRLHAVALATSIVEEYVRANAAWPKSWDDLEQVKPNAVWTSAYSWPRDAEIVKRYVYIDFTLSLSEVRAAQSATEFSALSPLGECADTYTLFIRELMATIESTCQGNGK